MADLVSQDGRQLSQRLHHIVPFESENPSSLASIRLLTNHSGRSNFKRRGAASKRLIIATRRKGTSVTWDKREPMLKDILSDPITKQVMKADNVDPHQLSAMLKEMGQRWAEAHPSSMCCRWHEMHE